MTSVILAMLVILSVAAATAGVVVVGMEGRGRSRAPRLAEKMTRAAEYLNSDGQPPGA